jgi:hypothetical protein
LRDLKPDSAENFASTSQWGKVISGGPILFLITLGLPKKSKKNLVKIRIVQTYSSKNEGA